MIMHNFTVVTCRGQNSSISKVMFRLKRSYSMNWENVALQQE